MVKLSIGDFINFYPGVSVVDLAHCEMVLLLLKEDRVISFCDENGEF